ncbi:hypothetical protein SLA_4721 [Streptomyces laurentii]|uniref:Uncharacterized protein n=1 Tax=Streptomyces laurentii TaxID=39478 RepID=A0A160P431_STRLU|nr:hypothetical protein SLA_4721 [Streptomyces laurentii]
MGVGVGLGGAAVEGAPVAGAGPVPVGGGPEEELFEQAVMVTSATAAAISAGPRRGPRMEYRITRNPPSRREPCRLGSSVYPGSETHSS